MAEITRSGVSDPLDKTDEPGLYGKGNATRGRNARWGRARRARCARVPGRRVVRRGAGVWRRGAAHARRPPSRPPTADPAARESELPLMRIRPLAAGSSSTSASSGEYRELLFFLAWRDVKVRYKQTVLGAAWAVLQPLMMMVVFTIFFGRMAGAARRAACPTRSSPSPACCPGPSSPRPSPARATASSARSGSSPRSTSRGWPIPFAAVGAAVVDFVIAFGCCWSLMVWYGIAPGPGLLLVPAGLRPDRAGGAWASARSGGPERRLPRLPLRDPVPGPALDVRHADASTCSSKPRRRSAVGGCCTPALQPDDRR